MSLQFWPAERRVPKEHIDQHLKFIMKNSILDNSPVMPAIITHLSAVMFRGRDGVQRRPIWVPMIPDR